MHPRLIVRGVAFAYRDAAPVLESVDLSLSAGWHALVGANGSGKSTLLRLLAGELMLRAGAIERPDDARVIVCAQSVDAPVDRELAERDDRAAFRLRASLALDPAELDRWPTLSPGERRRWQVGAALAREPEVLLLDEPTNHLDAEGRALLVRALRAFRGIGIVVSHDRALLDTIATSTIRLEHGHARAWAGNYSAARSAWETEARARADERELRKAAVRRAERSLDDARRVQASAERGRSASKRMRSPHDSDARTITASTRAMWAEAGAGRAVGRRHAELSRAGAELCGSARSLRSRTGARAARADGRDRSGRADFAIGAGLETSAPATRERGRAIFVDFEPAARRVVLAVDADEICVGDRVLLRDVRLSLGRAARVRLCGPNGAGKTTLLHAMLGERDPRVLFVPQEITSDDTARAIAGLRALPPDERGRALSLIAALGADPGRILASGSASPGEARQIAIAAGLAARAHTVVLDEPTNHLDLPAIERLEDALADFPGALLIVTHDDALASRLQLEEWRIEEGIVHVRG